MHSPFQAQSTSYPLRLPGPLRQKHQTHRTSKFPVSVNIRRLHRVCERRRFRKSAHKRDKSVHDGVMALAWGGAPLLGNNGAGGSRAPEFEGGGGRRAGGGDCGEGGGGDGAEGATTCF